MFRLVIFALIPLALGACTITQTVDPVAEVPTNEVCIIENPQVREGFLPELKNSLRSKNAQVRVLSADATTTDCLIVATYVARWKWDLAMYMSYAEINVYHKGQIAGKALYDATSGSGNMGKFIDAEPKIQELVGQLFPTDFPPAGADGDVVNGTTPTIGSDKDLYAEILKLDDLRQRGLITDEEYENEKREILLEN